MKTQTVHLGFEVGTGEPVEVPLCNTIVTGQTQAAGKTTTLEAMIARCDLPAIAFVTKRFESAFGNARRIRPYFRDRADWQYVASVLEAIMGEKFRYERPWIVRVCKGATALNTVHSNVEAALKKTKSGRNHDTYLMLNEYLNIVVPVISKIRWADTVDLQPGLNVMDLSTMPEQLHGLVIGSVLEWIYHNASGSITIIPEAWEFVPQSRQSPVKLAAEQLIRKGSAGRNFIWLDSQDIAGVDASIRKSVPLWLLGVQRERNEVERVIKHLSGKKPKPEDVMDLDKGQFYVSWQRRLYKTYVQPVWMGEATARDISLGAVIETAGPPVRGQREHMVMYDDEQKLEEEEEPTFDFSQPDPIDDDPYFGASEPEDDDMTDDQVKQLGDHIVRGLTPLFEQTPSHGAAPGYTGAFDPNANGDTDAPPLAAPPSGDVGEDLYQQIRARLLADPAVLKVLASVPKLTVELEEYEVTVDTRKPSYGLVAMLIADGFFDQPTTGHAVFVELKRRGYKLAKPTAYDWCKKLAGMGFLFVEGSDFVAVPSMKKNIKTVTAKKAG